MVRSVELNSQEKENFRYQHNFPVAKTSLKVYST